MNKATTTVASVPLTWAEDDALAKLAARLGVPKAGVFRLGLLAMLQEHIPSEAAKMLRGRITRHVACSAIAVLFIGYIEVNSWRTGDAPEFRRARVTRTAKVVRGKEMEVA